MARSKSSRAEEIKFMAGFLTQPESLIRAIEAEPKGGGEELEGINFVWGNVTNMIPSLNTRPPHTHDSKFLKLNPKYVFHLDNLSSKQQQFIVGNYNIELDSFSSRKNKADILLVDNSGQVTYISVKDEFGLTKLGQVANREYGLAKLTGGFTAIELDRFDYPEEISYLDTWLSEEQWQTIEKKDRECAFLKRQYPDEWDLIVENSLNNAYECLKEFASNIGRDRNSICQFILLTLVGQSVSHENFYIVFGNQMIDIQRLLTNIRTMDFEVKSEQYISHGKKHKESLIIWLQFPNRRYCLTKIEPAFDGGRGTVRQTKGIQFYFQHWPQKTVSHEVYDFKQFLLDISQ